MQAGVSGLKVTCSLHAVENEWFDIDIEMADLEANICSYL
jgi:hypothetical protein